MSLGCLLDYFPGLLMILLLWITQLYHFFVYIKNLNHFQSYLSLKFGMNWEYIHLRIHCDLWELHFSKLNMETRSSKASVWSSKPNHAQQTLKLSWVNLNRNCFRCQLACISSFTLFLQQTVSEFVVENFYLQSKKNW